MKAGVVAGVLAALSDGPASRPTSGFRTGPTAELRNASRAARWFRQTAKPVAYRIRLLPLSSFPDLPAAVATELNRRGCMIPQSFEAKQPENVIHGAFRAAGSSDWAALCSSQETTTLYVFFAGQRESPIALRSQADSAWLGAEPGSSVLGSAWGIAARSAADLRATPGLRRGLAIDHDAIDDARLERSLIIHYFQAGRWMNLHAE